MFFAGCLSLAIGFLKEVVDATNLLPWCHNSGQYDDNYSGNGNNGDDENYYYCRFDLLDLMVDLNGATGAVLLIILIRFYCCVNKRNHPNSTDDDTTTVASTVFDGDRTVHFEEELEMIDEEQKNDETIMP